MKYLYSYNETLTKTYDKELVLKYLSTKLGEKDFWVHNTNVYISITHSNYKLIPEIINRLENLYKWFLSGVEGDFYEEVDNNVEDFKQDLLSIFSEIFNSDEDHEMDGFYTMVFEPYFGEKETVPNILYHITDDSRLKSILKNGLVAKHQNKLTYHPERIYLSTTEEKLVELLKHSNFNINKPVVLTIDVKDIKDNMTFYSDVNFPTGVFTTDNIPPKCITSVKYPWE